MWSFRRGSLPFVVVVVHNLVLLATLMLVAVATVVSLSSISDAWFV